MQAAGRLRQLGPNGQRLQFAGTPDITRMVQLASGLEPGGAVGPQAIMQWVMDNTVQATLHGVLQWCDQGLYFALTEEHPERAVQDEVLELERLYAGSQGRQEVSQLAR